MHQVGNADRDHACWERPEDMDTSRQSYQVNASYPGSEPAAETAAALAAASMVFRTVDASYSDTLLQKSVQVRLAYLHWRRKSGWVLQPCHCTTFRMTITSTYCANKIIII